MKSTVFWIVLIVIAAGLQILGRMTPAPKKASKIEPATVVKPEGAAQARLTLQADAVKRLDIKTTTVRDESIDPTQRVGGEVVSVSADLKTAIVRVELTEIEAGKVRREEPASVLPVGRDSTMSPIKAQPLSGAIAHTLSLDSKVRRIKALPLKRATESGLYAVPGTLHYEISNVDHGLVNRQLVFVELPLVGNGEKRKIIPHAAVLYDAKGNTWVYTNPEPLVYLRQAVRIDTIIGDDALLLDGPAVGTAVVTVGGAELFGTEFGVGK
jgi:hypothetical protein